MNASNKKRFDSCKHLLLTTVSALVCASCVSTSLNNNLDTTVSGENNQIIFAWSENHPFAQEYARGNIQLVVEYNEVDQNDRVRPVKQMVRSKVRSFPEINTKTFSLPNALRSIPSDTNICLHLVSNGRPIPIRSSQQGQESSRFSYTNWQNSTYQNTTQDYYKNLLNLAQRNLEQAKKNEELAKGGINNKLSEFNRLLNRETKTRAYDISEKNQCDTIRVDPKLPQRTNEIMSPQNAQIAATNVCTLGALSMFNGALSKLADPNSSKQIRSRQLYLMTNTASILPFIFNNKISKSDITLPKEYAQVIENIYQNFEQFANSAIQYAQQPNAYKPEGVVISVSPHAVDANKMGMLSFFMTGKEPTFTPKQLFEVAYNEWTELKYCSFDMIKHLNTKRKAFELAQTNAPKRAKASTTYFQNYCKKVFSNQSNNDQKYALERKRAEVSVDNYKRKLKAVSDKVESSALQGKQQLNQLACSLK